MCKTRQEQAVTLRGGLQRGQHTCIKRINCRSRWPRCLRRRSEAAWLLGSRVRIPFKTWAFSSLVYVVCCVGGGLCDRVITRPEESYLMCVIMCDLKTSKESPRPDLGYSAIKKKSINEILHTCIIKWKI